MGISRDDFEVWYFGGMVVDGVCESVKNGHGVLGLGSGSGPCMGFGFSVCDWRKLIVE